jgi:hypothetical protein
LVAHPSGCALLICFANEQAKACSTEELYRKNDIGIILDLIYCRGRVTLPLRRYIIFEKIDATSSGA